MIHVSLCGHNLNSNKKLFGVGNWGWILGKIFLLICIYFTVECRTTVYFGEIVSLKIFIPHNSPMSSGLKQAKA